jgi:hypothetical protein
MFPDRNYCVCGLLKANSRVKFRLTKVDAGKLKHKYLNRPWSPMAVKVLRSQSGDELCYRLSPQFAERFFYAQNRTN